MGDKKIFDDFPVKDCNDCSNYWNDTCDGVVKGSEKRCTNFIAVKSVDIPVKIKALEGRVKWLEIVVGFTSIIFGLFMLSTLGG